MTDAENSRSPTIYMSDYPEHICVCICTYKRPHLLLRLLEALSCQKTDRAFDLSLSILDNDVKESAKETVAAFAKQSGIPTVYAMDPVPNFARARNRVVENGKGTYLAFIDDDEFPKNDWLLVMLKACQAHKADGVLGPVLPHFETPPPAWLTKAGFYDRPRHKTGHLMRWNESRTGNVLIRRSIIEGMEQVFNPDFGTGGEDLDFFRRMNEKGHRFIWCDEAPAYETVPPHRWERSFLIKRALLRGKSTLKHPTDRLSNIAKSCVATPLYGLALPFLLVIGHHHFMKYLVRFCDHAGRLLALVNLNPISERNN